jgi:hypothetical protein
LVLFWRYTTKGTRKEEIKQDKDLSFGDSILAGCVRGGMLYSDINEGIENYSACVFLYYDIHKQGVKAVNAGKLSGKLIKELPSSYQSYLKNLSNHEMYCLKLSYSEVNKLRKSGELFIPKNTITSSACFQSGEEFHPKLKIANKGVKKILSKSTTSVCVDQKIVVDFPKVTLELGKIIKLDDVLLNEKLKLNDEKEVLEKLLSKGFIKGRLGCLSMSWKDKISKKDYESISKLTIKILIYENLDLKGLNNDYKEIIGSIDNMIEDVWLHEWS